jgi:hypothetical protein
MNETLAGSALQYSVYIAEAVICIQFASRTRWRRWTAPALYTLTLFLVDAVGRPMVLYRYGWASQQYAYCYWLTNVVLQLAAFLLICSFFRRAYRNSGNTWPILRLLLVCVFVFLAGGAYVTLSRNFDHLLTRYIYQFEQNLYFACLVLNTLLYLFLQQMDNKEKNLEAMLCGTGLQFAAPAAIMALVWLSHGRSYGWTLAQHLEPLCTLAMLIIWGHTLIGEGNVGTETAGIRVSASNI